MSDFINTIDVLGDEAVIDSIINRTITEFNDDNITAIGKCAFNNCTNLESVIFPNATSIGDSAFKASGLKAITPETFPKLKEFSTRAFDNCTSLESVSLPSLERIHNTYGFANCTSLRNVDLPNVTTIANHTFNGCSSLIDVNLPKLEILRDSTFFNCKALKSIVLPCVTALQGYSCFAECNSLEFVDLPVCANIPGQYHFRYNYALTALILRNTESVCTLESASSFTQSGIENGIGYIYVPQELLSSYRSATNWSTYVYQFRALENYTVDGTITGKIREHCESLSLDVTELTLTDANNYILNATGALGILDSIIWDSSNLKVARVINGTIIPVGDGTATITATCGDYSATCAVTVNAGLVAPVYDIAIFPYNGLDKGELPVYKLDVTAGTTLELTYYLNSSGGMLYDGRSCGSDYKLDNNVVGEETTTTLKVQSDGVIYFSGQFNNDKDKHGQLATTQSDRLYGKYLYVRVL